MYVVNQTRGTFLGVDVKRAGGFRARLIGLYRHRKLSLGDGVWLVPCKGIQTVGMRTAIDVVFLDAEALLPNTRTVLDPLGVFLGLRTPLSTEYRRFAHAG